MTLRTMTLVAATAPAGAMALVAATGPATLVAAAGPATTAAGSDSLFQLLASNIHYANAVTFGKCVIASATFSVGYS